MVGGTVDAFSSYLGAGLLEPGDAYDPGGSAGGFGVYWDRPVEVPGAFVTPAPLAGRYSVGAAMAATGRALDWYRDQVLVDTVAVDALLAEAAAISATSQAFAPNCISRERARSAASSTTSGVCPADGCGSGLGMRAF